MYTLYNNDCFEVMKEIEDGSIDLVLTDPPYEINHTGGGGFMREREYVNEMRDMKILDGYDVSGFLDLIKPKFKTGTYNLVTFCSMRQLKDYIAYAEANGYNYGITIWHKSDPAPLCNNNYLKDIEFCVYINKNKRIGGTYQTKSLVYKSATNRKDKERYGHPTIKPLGLLNKYIKNHSDEGDVVADFFMGTGSTGVAAINNKRKFIGIEWKEKWYNIAQERLKQSDNNLEGIF
jgi:DNA modification methylase